MKHFKGAGEHSVNELEMMIIERDNILSKIRMCANSYREWITHYGVNQMTTQKQAFDSLLKVIFNRE